MRRGDIAEDASSDAAARNAVRDIIAGVEDLLRGLRPQDLGTPRPGLPIVSVDLRRASDSPSLRDVGLWLIPQAMAPGNTRGRFVWSPSGRRVELFVKPPVGLPSSPSLEQWTAAVLRHGPKMVASAREHLRHELVHLLDAERMGDPSVGQAFGRQRARLGKTSPVELNAYFQQALSKVEDSVLRSRSRGEFTLRTGGSASGLFKKVMMELPSHLVSSMDDDARRRLMKRSAAMFAHLKSRVRF